MSETSRVRPRRIIRGYGNLRAFTGYGRSQTKEFIARGEFPAPMQLGPLGSRAIGWFEEDIVAWQEKIAAQKQPGKSSKQREAGKEVD